MKTKPTQPSPEKLAVLRAEGKVLYHYPPHYYGYHHGYTTVTRCQDCFATALCEDCHPVNLCRWCGGVMEEVGAARWQEGEPKVVKTYFFGLFKKTCRTGRWVFADKNNELPI